MSGALHLEITVSSIERARADLAAVWIFCDERPLQGNSGRVDWRLCGRLSALVTGQRLHGEPGEAALVATFGGLSVPWLLVVGAGPREAFDARRFEEVVCDAVGRAAALQARTLALSLPGDRVGQAAQERRARALLTGAAAGLASFGRGAELRLRLLVAGEDASHTVELLRRARPAQLPGEVALRLPGPAAAVSA